MKRKKIFITQFDKERIEELIAVRENRREGARDRNDLQELHEELQRAEVVAPESVPPNVVTMNSKILLRDLDSGEDETYSLVFPADADIDNGAISVLAPIGTALLGYRVGDTIKWPVPSGVRALRIEKILYQPEAAGDLNR